MKEMNSDTEKMQCPSCEYLIDELREQARLNGMGSEREAKLLAEIEVLKARLRKSDEGGKMKPGRELDVLVAEKVMGRRVQWQPASALFPVADHDGPPYSTDIAAAWEVVEKLKSIIQDLEIEISSSAEYRDEWEVALKWLDSHQSYGPFYFCAPTAPHAICLAALKAVGVS